MEVSKFGAGMTLRNDVETLERFSDLEDFGDRNAISVPSCCDLFFREVLTVRSDSQDQVAVLGLESKRP
jgi:hypothetical protein